MVWFGRCDYRQGSSMGTNYVQLLCGIFPGENNVLRNRNTVQHIHCLSDSVTHIGPELGKDKTDALTESHKHIIKGSIID